MRGASCSLMSTGRLGFLTRFLLGLSHCLRWSVMHQRTYIAACTSFCGAIVQLAGICAVLLAAAINAFWDILML